MIMGVPLSSTMMLGTTGSAGFLVERADACSSPQAQNATVRARAKAFENVTGIHKT